MMYDQSVFLGIAKDLRDLADVIEQSNCEYISGDFSIHKSVNLNTYPNAPTLKTSINISSDFRFKISQK